MDARSEGMPGRAAFGPEQQTPEILSPQPPATRSRPGRISGTALPFGVHLSTGVYGSASTPHLMLGGMNIILLGAISLVVTYIEAWLLEMAFDVPLSAFLIGVTPQIPGADAQVWSAVINILPFVNFLFVLRLSSLAGYHAAEHKVVSAIEQYGYATFELAKEMPRVHPRCGTVLLLGILPALMVAAPLAMHGLYIWAAIVALIGWTLRYHTGFLIQNYFTTKPPTQHQLRKGLEAGNTILEAWRRDPHRKVPWLRSIWIRGFPQMVIGVLIGSQVLQYIYSNLHIWLDF